MVQIKQMWEKESAAKVYKKEWGRERERARERREREIRWDKMFWSFPAI